MTQPSSVPITVYAQTSKELCFRLDNEPDLRACDIFFRVKKFDTDETWVINKRPTLEKSPNLICGEFVIDILPADTTGLDPRTYRYELIICCPDNCVSVPAAGDFNVIASLDC